MSLPMFHRELQQLRVQLHCLSLYHLHTTPAINLPWTTWHRRPTRGIPVGADPKHYCASIGRSRSNERWSTKPASSGRPIRAHSRRTLPTQMNVLGASEALPSTPSNELSTNSGGSCHFSNDSKVGMSMPPSRTHFTDYASLRLENRCNFYETAFIKLQRERALRWPHWIRIIPPILMLDEITLRISLWLL